MTVTPEQAMEMFDRDLEILMDDLRGMQVHYQIAEWEAFVFLRKPNRPESYVVKYAAADDRFAQQIVQLHATPAPSATTQDEAPDRIWLTREEISGHRTWVQASGHDSDHVEYTRVVSVDESSLSKYILGFCPERGRGNAILSVEGELTLLGKRLVRGLAARFAFAVGRFQTRDTGNL